MKMKSKYMLIATVVSGAVLTIALITVYNMLPIATGFAAKNMCSCLFVANREFSSIEENDLNFSLVKYVKNVVDYENRTVRSTFLGMQPRIAVYRKDGGCTLTDSREALAATAECEKGSSQVDSLYGHDGKLQVANSKINPKLLEAVDQAFDKPGDRKFKKTRAVLVLKAGEILAEKYLDGFDAETLQLGWSMNKSIVNALAGIMVRKGLLDIDEATGIPLWQSDERRKITYRHLLQMNSGLKWREVYGTASDVTRMLYKSESPYEYAISKPSAFQPGSKWVYASGTSNILAGLFMKKLGGAEAYRCFLQRELFDKIGMSSIIMEQDRKDRFISSSYAFATPRDWARFGLLYLNDGICNGVRILPEGWVDLTTEPAKGSGGEYGAHFWLNKSGELKDVPGDVFGAHGFQGQRVFIVPSKDMVVVRLGISKDGDFDFNSWLSSVISAVE